MVNAESGRRRAIRIVLVALVAAGVVTGVVWALAGVSIVHRGPEADDISSMWTGSSRITMSRKTSDLAIGYTMQSDFWFRVDADGNVRGKAYAVYRPMFDAAGMNNKVTVAKSVVNGALSLLPGGELGVYKNAIAAGKAGTSVSLSGLVGVVGTYEDPKPVRVGAISGSLRKGTLRLAWADPEAEPAGIPATISLQYINTQQPIAHPTLKTRTPWQDAATIDPDSTGRFAIAQSQQSSTKEGVSESTFSYWNATRLQ